MAKKPSPYQILPTADARRIVKPVKPQPAKSPNDKGGPFGIAPPAKPPVKPIAVKPPPKAVKPPVAPPAGPPPPQDQGPPQQSFEDFLAGLFGNQGGQPQAPQQSFQDFISQFFQPQQQPDYGAIMKQLFAPVQQEYQSQLGNLSQFNGAQSEAVKSFTSQLVNQLQGLGDSVYTPELAGALGLEQQRESGWSQYQNQQKLYDSLIGGFQHDLPDLFSKLVDQYAPQQPSTSDLIQLRNLYDNENPQQGAGGLDPSQVLSALNAYNSTYGSPFDQQKLGLDQQKYTDSQAIAQAKLKDQRANEAFARDALAKKLGIQQQTNDRNYQIKVTNLKASVAYKNATLKQRQQMINSLAKYRTTQTNVAQQKADTAARNTNLAVAKYQTQIQQFNAKQKQNAAKLSLPNASISGKVGYLADSSGNPMLTKNGGLQVLPGFTVKGGQVVKVGTKKPPLTAAKRAELLGRGMAIAQGSFKGVPPDPNKPGDNGHPQQNYTGAVREAEKAGVPLTLAIKAANKYYAAGVRGRPYPAPTRDAGFKTATVTPKKKKR